MTTSIDRATRDRAKLPSAQQRPTVGRCRLLIGVRIFAAVTAAAGVGLGVADLTMGRSVTLIAAAVTCVLLAALAGTVLVLDALLADRQEFYRRGQLDGWMRSWHGQPPEMDDPLLKP